MESGISEYARIFSITGMVRRISSASDTGSAPGRVDSPPISIISALREVRHRPRVIEQVRPEGPEAQRSGVLHRAPRADEWRRINGGCLRAVQLRGCLRCLFVCEGDWQAQLDEQPVAGRRVGYIRLDSQQACAFAQHRADRAVVPRKFHGQASITRIRAEALRPESAFRVREFSTAPEARLVPVRQTDLSRPVFLAPSPEVVAPRHRPDRLQACAVRDERRVEIRQRRIVALVERQAGDQGIRAVCLPDDGTRRGEKIDERIVVFVEHFELRQWRMDRDDFGNPCAVPGIEVHRLDADGRSLAHVLERHRCVRDDGCWVVDGDRRDALHGLANRGAGLPFLGCLARKNLLLC